MQIEIKEKLLTFLKKIANANPDIPIKVLKAEAMELETNLTLSEYSINLQTPKELYKEIAGLSGYQKRHFETVVWLTNPMGPRGVGRTQLMALSFIQHSLYCGDWVRVYDHNYNTRRSEEMVRRISEIVSRIDGLTLSIKNIYGHPQILVSRVPEDSRIQYNSDIKWEDELKK